MLEREAYDYEQMSVGWWPGSASFPDPAFYAYAYPKPDGIEQAELGIAGRGVGTTSSASSSSLYEDVRAAASPASCAARVPRRRLRRVHVPRAGWDARLVGGS